jgi:hypothetical protein
MWTREPIYQDLPSGDVSSRGIGVQYFLEGAVTGAEYLNMLEVSIMAAIHQLHKYDGHSDILIVMSGPILVTITQNGR